MGPGELGENIRRLRREAGLGLRELSRASEISAATLSAIEQGRSSPTLANLHKILRALGTNFAAFFAEGPAGEDCPVFSAKSMKTFRDAHRRYTLLLPKRADVRFEALHEVLLPTEKASAWETHDCDLGGIVLSGGPGVLQMEGAGEWPVRKGDAFYVKAGQRHRLCVKGRRLELITIWYPPRY